MKTQLNILSRKEINHIYGIPSLNPQQRVVYLELTLAEQELAHKYRGSITKTYFILQLAYFKFRQQFFIFDLEQVEKDVEYVQQTYFAKQPITKSGMISKPTRLAQRRVILKLMGYRMADKVVRKQLFDRARGVARLSSDPLFIFRDLINWATQQRIVLPGYSVMQRSIIGKAITLERIRLEGLLKKHLPNTQQQQLNNLLTERVEHYYKLSWIQQEATNFNPQSIRGEIKRKKVLNSLFKTGKPLIKKLGISNENINYYARLANHYTVGELRQFKGGVHYIYMLCYIQHRYRQINDVLAEAFKYYVRKYEAQARQVVQEYFYKFHLDANEQLNKIPAILEMLTGDSIADNTPFSLVRKQVLDILDREKILLLTDFIKKNRWIRRKFGGAIMKKFKDRLVIIYAIYLPT